MKKYCMRCMHIIEHGDVCPSCGEIPPQRVQADMLQPGTILKERYLIGNALGQGGFGITYIGCDLLLNIRVAVKEYYPTGYATRNVFDSPSITISNPQHDSFIRNGIEKFLGEARSLAEFHEESGIVDVRDFFRDNNTAYIVMEYLDGATLQQCIKENCFTPDYIFNLMAPVIDSMEKMHQKQVIHRDISPDNIMLMKDGHLKLMDFGAARQVDFSSKKSMSVVLKAGFAPIEQYRPKGELGPWTDIYALCATIYVCITGIHPDISLERAFDDDIKWPQELGVPISNELQDVLKKGMAVNSKDRYQNIDELRIAINNAKDAQIIQPNSMEGIMEKSCLDQQNGQQAITRIVSELINEKKELENNLYSSNVSAAISSKKMAMTVAVIDDNQLTALQTTTEPPILMSDNKKKNADNKMPSKFSNKVRSALPTQGSKSQIKLLPNKSVIIGICIALFIFVVCITIVFMNKDSGVESTIDTSPPTPTYMSMMVDAGNILKSFGIASPVTSLDINSENYSEKYGTYLAICNLKVSGANADEEKTVKLMYKYENDTWNLDVNSCSVN